MAFSGAWAARSQQPQNVALTPGIDSQHMKPDPDPNLPQGQRPDWQQATAVPDMPVALMGSIPSVDHIGIGPVDSVNYENTLGGMGSGHGLDPLQAMDASRDAHMTDDGSYAARMYRAAVDRDGTYHAAIVHATPGDGESPQTLAMQQTGVGAPTDQGNSRQSKRITRWAERRIDMHWWEVAFRPLRPNYARPVAVSQVTETNQRAPGTPSVVGWNPSTSDRFVEPMTRRSPGDWQEPFTADGTRTAMATAQGQFALGSWGL